MHISVLQLLPECARSLSRPSGLQLDDLDQIWDTTKIILIVLLTCEPVNGHSDGRVRLLL